MIWQDQLVCNSLPSQGKSYACTLQWQVLYQITEVPNRFFQTSWGHVHVCRILLKHDSVTCSKTVLATAGRSSNTPALQCKGYVSSEEIV